MMEIERQFTLLLVDDNPTNLLLLVKIIELDLPEVRTLTAASALEGLALAEREAIDGAFIDVQMPQMDGLEMCRRLRQQPRTARIPLVLMTAHIASPEMRAEGLEVGAHDFISQPISNVEMLARIKVMLRLCENEQHATEHADRLRWISGLLISGNGALVRQDQQLLHHLVHQLPDPEKIDAKQFFSTMVTEFPLPWRRTLLKLSLLDSIPVTLAQQLSEITDVAAVFDYLSRHQLLLLQTLEGEEYLSLKSEAKDLLREKAVQSLSGAEREQVCLIAADWYLQKNAYAAALKSLLAAEHYPAISQFLERVGLALLDRDCRSQIFSLLDQVPEEEANASGWLALFRGFALLQNISLAAAGWLEHAYRHFTTAGELRGVLLTLAQQTRMAIFMDGALTGVVERLSQFRELAVSQHEALGSLERLQVAYALGLAELFLGDKFAAVDSILEQSLAEAQRLQLRERQLELNLLRSLSALHQGRYLVARTALERGMVFVAKNDDFPENLVLQVVACELLHAAGDLSGFQQQQALLQDNCLSKKMVENGILKSFLSYFSASLFLARGDFQRALEIVEIALLDGDAVLNSHMRSRLLQLRGVLHALSGSKLAAQNDCETGLQLRQQAGGDLWRLENLLFAGASCYVLEHYAQAEEYLTTGLAESLKYQEERFRAGFHAWVAVVLQHCGKEKEVAAQIEAFLEQLRRHKLNFFWGMTAELMSDLLPLVDRQKQKLLHPLLQEQLFCTVGDNGCLVPLIRVSCLGKFQLELEGQLFDLSHVGHASRQILALLVTAPNHSLSIELMMGTLWPDSPARKARNSFDAAHSRLRKSLEKSFGKRIRRDYLVLEKGMLSLRYAQIDSIELIEAQEQVRYHRQREQLWQAEQSLWRMDRLWGGEFLSGYELDGELARQRERLLQLRLEQLGLLARRLCQQRREDKAAQLLQQGLLLDPTHDPIIRQLLELYRRRNDTHAIRFLLENYRQMLKNENYSPMEIAEFMAVLQG